MSNLAVPGGDDFPGAAGKHLDDAEALLAAKRYDGAGYLAGYAVECSLKSLILIDEIAKTKGSGMPVVDGLDSGGRRARSFSHNLSKLSSEATALAAIAGAVTAPYVPRSGFGGLDITSAAGWKETIRYCESGHIDEPKAKTWVGEARSVYERTIARMRRNGVVLF